MKFKKTIKTFFIVSLGLAGAGTVWAQTPQELGSGVTRAAVHAQKAHRQEQALATVSFDWEKNLYLSDKIRRRRPGFQDVLLKTERQTTVCRGVLAAGTRRVVTPASCAKAPDGFQLKQVRVHLANGRKGRGTANSVAVSGDFAGVLVSSQLTAGIQGVPLAAVPEGKSLYDVFGRGVQQQLLEFFVNRGVVSARANRLTGVKNTLQKGEPFFYQGQLVALVEEVPNRLPVSFWGGISEDSLSIFRPGVREGLLAAK